jgi:hypothetical protein
MTCPTWRDSLVVERPEITQIVGDDCAALSAGERQHLGIRQSLAIRMTRNWLHIMPA